MGLQREAESAEKKGDIGALGAVIGVELVEDEVLEAFGGLLPDAGVGAAQQQLVEHLVVGEEDVRRILPDGFLRGNERLFRDPDDTTFAGFTGVDACGHRA